MRSLERVVPMPDAGFSVAGFPSGFIPLTSSSEFQFAQLGHSRSVRCYARILPSVCISTLGRLKILLSFPARRAPLVFPV